MTYVELALDLKAHAERALPALSDHRPRGDTPALRSKGRVLKMALDALQPHVQVAGVLPGKELWIAKFLVPLGLLVCWAGNTPTVCATFRHAVSNAPGEGALLGAMDEAFGG